MERRRNRPVKYDRELMGKTLVAMQRVREIREARQARHWEARMARARRVTVRNDRRQLEQEVHLVRAPHVAREERERARVAAEEARREEGREEEG